MRLPSAMRGSVLLYSTVVTIWAVTEAVYFAQRRQQVCLHSSWKRGAVLGRLYAYPNSIDNCSTDDVHFDLISNSDIVDINSTSGWLYLTQDTTELRNDVTVDIYASCLTTEGGTTSSARTSVTISNCSGDFKNVSPDALCFSHLPDGMLAVEENVKDVIIGRLSTSLQEHNFTREYTVLSPKVRFIIDADTSELTVIKALDRDSLSEPTTGKTPGNITGNQLLRVSCRITRANKTYTVKRRLKVAVLDVNDSPPTFQDGSQIKRVDIEVKENVQQMSVNETLVDKDGWSNNTYSLQVTNDHNNVCVSQIKCLDTGLGHAACHLNVTLSNLQATRFTLYQCEISIVDRLFVQPVATSKANNTAKLIITLHKDDANSPTAMSLKSNMIFVFYRNATKLARLTQLGHEGRYRQQPSKYKLRHGIFNVTQVTGIVYVHDTTALAVADDVIRFTVTTTKGNKYNMVVNMYGNGRSEPSCDPDGGCSLHKTTESCRSSCGLGLSRDNCVMRGSETTTGMSKEYGTCTYNSSTCPDGVCDELENMQPLLCPQDCTKIRVGAVMPGSPARGIRMAMSPCWCDWFAECTCMNIQPQVLSSLNREASVSPLVSMQLTTREQSTEAGYNMVLEQEVTGQITNTSSAIGMSREKHGGVDCGTMCVAGIGLGVGSFLLISFSLFMLWFTKRLNDKRKSNLKHVGSVNSMSGVASDYYLEEREARVSSSSDQWSPKRPDYSSSNTHTTTTLYNMYSDDGVWEIDREKLSLEKTLGEGEFGLVVKGVLTTGSGENNCKYVAVKMLKHCSSQLEEQDLWSEFNLLKDVSHPNVIRLLGACTSGGPFYLVVEFCESGCLLKYLRRSRFEENGYVNSIRRFKSPQCHEQTDQDLDGDLLRMRDLLSFAWQIAKGMSYLSEIKLVHRDLAARNILVASGRVLKVSDFGLTRDVYEADTYLKKSKSRIPVKWLAPESLYAQIYTTRSDIWSYGIVLWEIVTLGAPPYPGIPPERLYNLLLGGYRMDKPETCPDEMYAVMQKCWKVDAADRPSFATLASIFDRILQEKTGYLDLSKGNARAADMYYKRSRKDRTDDCCNMKCSSDHNQQSLKSDDTITYSTLACVASSTVCNDTYDSRTSVPTVCNQTYATGKTAPDVYPDNEASGSGAYLEPISHRHKDPMSNRHNDDTDNSADTCNQMTPLLDVSGIAKASDKNTIGVHKNGRRVHVTDVNVHKTDKDVNNVSESAAGKKEQDGINVSVDTVDPIFRKKTEYTVAQAKFTRNKHTVYPFEQVKLLCDSGTTSGCLTTGEDIHHKETTEC